MARVKVLKKHADDDLIEMFNNTINFGGSALYTKMLPKVARLLSVSSTIQRRFRTFTKTEICTDEAVKQISTWLDENEVVLRGETIIREYDEFVQFCKRFELAPESNTLEDHVEFSAWAKDKQASADEQTIRAMTEEFDAFKNLNAFNVYLVVCNQLVKYKKFLGQEDEASMSFIARLSTSTFAPLSEITSIDFICAYRQSPQYAYRFLSEIFRLTMLVYQYIMQPEIDVALFGAKMTEHIQTARKMIPRCDKAFNAIERSMDLFKDKFDSYYKDFVITKNPGSIMENYIVDICNAETKKNPEMIRQFRDIIKHFRKHIQSTGGDMRGLQILKLLEEKYQLLDSKQAEMPEVMDAVAQSDVAVQIAEQEEKIKSANLTRNQKRHARRKIARARKLEQDATVQTDGEDTNV